MTLTRDKTGERLDAALARLVPSLSRSQAQRLIEQGAVTHGGRPVKKNEKLSAGDTPVSYTHLAFLSCAQIRSGNHRLPCVEAFL